MSPKKLEPPHATVKEAVQKRITSNDRSSIIPGIDINELKHSLDLLKYALDYSEAIVDTIRSPLIVLDRNLRVLTANKSFYLTFDVTPKETENKLIYEIGQSEWNNPQLRVLLEEILPKNTLFNDFEVDINFPKTGNKTFLLSARRTYRQVNNTEAILLAFDDVTDRKELEKSKDDFIGIVSHELKTPLTSIKAFSQILEKHLKSTHDTKGAFFRTKMANQMEQLTQLMASFVNVYKIQNGKLRLHKEKFYVGDLIKEVVQDFQYTTKSHKLLVSFEKKMNVFADKERIRQVLINLISNAIKYSPQGDKVIIKATKNKDEVVVSVEDFGMGIPKTEQDKIFDRFFRVKGKREKNISGLGLGLYISAEIVKQHKGKIWMDSRERKGSTFYISLPSA